MVSFGDDSTLIKVAVFGLTISIMATACIALLIAPNNTYDYDDIAKYRNELANFSGKSMINNTPWVLTSVKTPWEVGMPYEGHIDEDGWLFGEEIAYSEIGKAAGIRLDPAQKSSTMLSNSTQDYSYIDGRQWYAGGNPWGIAINDTYLDFFGIDPYTRNSGVANTYSFTGYRYIFNPTLPFQAGTSSVDGSLSIVWYSFNNQEGLSGGLEIYNRDILLSSYSATDIIGAYESVGGYAATYDFNFNGVVLKLSIMFDQAQLESGVSLYQAWVNGYWSMAISSLSAGNFFDVENSAAFANTAGSMIDTFIGIYTMSTPSINNPWMDVILWLLVGLPMTLALACITLRLIQSVKIF